MSNQVAIIIAGFLVAGAIAVTNHWSVSQINNGYGILQLNRWTGNIAGQCVWKGEKPTEQMTCF